MEKSSERKIFLLQIVSDVCRGIKRNPEQNDQSQIFSTCRCRQLYRLMYIATQVAQTRKKADPSTYRREFKESHKFSGAG